MVTPNFFLKIKFSPNKKMSITSQVGTHVKNPGPHNLFMILEKKKTSKKKNCTTESINKQIIISNNVRSKEIFLELWFLHFHILFNKYGFQMMFRNLGSYTFYYIGMYTFKTFKKISKSMVSNTIKDV